MLPDRIQSKISPEPNSGCWLWDASVNRAGYGTANYQRKRRLAHRVVYELTNGPIPDGLQLDHLCRTRSCVNPAHLEPVTCKENLNRSALIGKCRTIHIHRETCVNGHDRTDPANVYMRPDNGRRGHCLRCAQDRERRRVRVR
jgi:hypothetical protein